MNIKKLSAVTALVGLICGCMSLEERLASSDYETRKEAETELYTSAVRSGSETEVLQAVSRMTCDELLAAVATTRNSQSITKPAVEKMKDEKWLAAVAMYSKDAAIQSSAIAKIRNQALLLELYKKIDDETVKSKVVARMDPTTFAKIPYSSAMAKRWKSILDQQLLAKIIAKDLIAVPSAEWGELTAKVTDESLKEGLQESLAWAYASNFDALSEEAKKFLVDNITDKAIAEEMVREPDWSEVKSEDARLQRELAQIRRYISDETEQMNGDLREVKKYEARWVLDSNEQGRLERYKGSAAEHRKKLDEYQTQLRKLEESAPRRLYVKDETGRQTILEKFGDEFISKFADEKIKALKDFHAGESEKWDECNTLVAKIRSENLKLKYYRQLLEKIDDDERHSKGGVGLFGGRLYKWSSDDSMKAQLFVDSWLLDKRPEDAEKMLAMGTKGYKYLIKYLSQDRLLQLMKKGTIKDVGLQLLIVNTLDGKLFDVELYKSVRNVDVRKTMFSRMPESMRSAVVTASAKMVDEIFAKAEAAKKTTFVLKGFYLGMPMDDAKMLLAHYFPKAVITEGSNYIDVDVTEKSVHQMHFCEAEKGLLVRINFDVKMLKKFFAYDVQTYEEWAQAFVNEHGEVRFVGRHVQGKKEIESAWVSVTQEAYYYKGNRQGYALTYFGEKHVTDLSGLVDTSSSNTSDAFGAFATGFQMGIRQGLKEWPNTGWENAEGAREGTLRLELLKGGE